MIVNIYQYLFKSDMSVGQVTDIENLALEHYIMSKSNRHNFLVTTEATRSHG